MRINNYIKAERLTIKYGYDLLLEYFK